jgi:hypothetical protein
MIKVACQFISVLDYRKGPGHVDELSLNDQGIARHDTRTEQWGSTAVKPGMIRPKISGKGG